MRPLFLLLAASVSLAPAQQIYDLLLRNGNVIDPANRRTGRMDVAIIGDRIVRVAPDLPASHARIVIDAGQYYVTPGLIDLNAHFGPAGVQPDHNELPYGVTTAVDGGSASARDFETFKASVIDHATTRVLAFLRVAGDPDAAATTARKYNRLVVGMAARDATSVEAALKAAEQTHTPVMAPAVAATLRSGDIVTNTYSRSASPPALEQVRRRGVLLDGTQGAEGLWFRVAAPAIRQGLLPDTISTGMDRASLMLPRATMTTTMSKFLNLGMTPEQIIERVTANAARTIHRSDLGALSEGAGADIALLEIEQGNFGFLDSGHARLAANRRFRCVLTVRNGKVVWDSEGLAAPDVLKAGPYSNFK